jgi:hypothetical protein
MLKAAQLVRDLHITDVVFPCSRDAVVGGVSVCTATDTAVLYTTLWDGCVSRITLFDVGAAASAATRGHSRLATPLVSSQPIVLHHAPSQCHCDVLAATPVCAVVVAPTGVTLVPLWERGDTAPPPADRAPVALHAIVAATPYGLDIVATAAVRDAGRQVWRDLSVWCPQPGSVATRGGATTKTAVSLLSGRTGQVLSSVSIPGTVHKAYGTPSSYVCIAGVKADCIVRRGCWILCR